MKRVLPIAGLLVVGTFTLTACTPPMPPEVIAALAEQTYTCEAGDTTFWAESSVASVAADWQSSVASSCPDMNLTVSASQSTASLLQITTGAAVGNSFDFVPFAVDAAVFVYNIEGIDGLTLDAAAIEGIFAGKIISWDDPVIAKLNPTFNLPNTAITFGNSLDAPAAKTMTAWLSRLANRAVALPVGTATLADPGSIVLTSYSVATANSQTMASIVTGKSLDTDFATPDSNGIMTAATQWKTSQAESGVTVELNASAKPIAPLGLDVAPTPYQAIFPVNLYLVGTDNLTTRAMARFLLRQDSQGSLAMSSVVALPETVRVVSLAAVSKGLPTPDVTAPTN